jgi:hypothetical protein
MPKQEQIAAYGYLNAWLSDYKKDHFISSSLGKSDGSEKPLAGTENSLNEKGRVEHYLHEQVCSGAMPLAQAQKKTSAD